VREREKEGKREGERQRLFLLVSTFKRSTATLSVLNTHLVGPDIHRSGFESERRMRTNEVDSFQRKQHLQIMQHHHHHH
jgi:hypothetical protein